MPLEHLISYLAVNLAKNAGISYSFQLFVSEEDLHIFALCQLRDSLIEYEELTGGPHPLDNLFNKLEISYDFHERVAQISKSSGDVQDA